MSNYNLYVIYQVCYANVCLHKHISNCGYNSKQFSSTYAIVLCKFEVKRAYKRYISWQTICGKVSSAADLTSSFMRFENEKL